MALQAGRNGDTEYLILHRTEGVVWLPEHWRRKLADPACEIDECDIEWPDPAGDDPAQLSLTNLGEMPEDWDPRDRTPPPQSLDAWDEGAYERTARALAARGWTLDQALDGSRLGWFHGQWGPVRPYVVVRDGGRREGKDANGRPWVETARSPL